MATPTQNYFFGAPEKNPGEAEDVYRKRVEAYWASLRKQPETADRPTTPKPKPGQGASFKLPEDKDAFEAYVKAHPEVKWTIDCANPAGLQEMLKYGQQLGILDNVVSANIRSEKRILEGAELQKMKDALPPLEAATTEKSGRPKAGLTQWPPRPRPPGST